MHKSQIEYNTNYFMPNNYLPYQPNMNSDFNKLKNKEVILYKTESCRNWTELGYCRYGKKCRYAHGESELRSVPRHIRYKTQICRAYHMDGSCPYGIRCTFVHETDTNEDRRNSLGSQNESLSSSSCSSTSSHCSLNYNNVYLKPQQQQPFVDNFYFNSNSAHNRTIWM